jgi:hypothetical protein
MRVVLAWLGTGLLICGLSLACGPSAPATPTPDADAFAVVRATSQAAYQVGQAELSRGDYLQACVDLDKAKTNDPDSRADIQQALDRAVAHGCTPATSVAQPTSPPAAAPQRTLAVATISAGVGTALVGTPAPSGTSTVPSAATLQVIAAATASPASTLSADTLSATRSPSDASTAVPGQLSTTPTPSTAPAALVTWTDPQGRFSIGAPAGWNRVDNPQALVGTGVVEFHDPSGRAQVDVAVDSSARAVSPELYAASLELAMQRQVPGYASEQIVPGTIAGNPSVQRVFTFTQRDDAGQDHQARGFQTAIVKASTPYLISGTAPADQYQQFGPTFDQMVESFRFS